MQRLLCGLVGEVTIQANTFLSENWKIVSVQLYALETRPTTDFTGKNIHDEPITYFEKYAAIVIEL